ncbi:Putative inositol monophosphatase 3 [Eumeta japonica]|uniref:inositol-phosphate phosphatase n=1 Tax=Eumeta variegata TaxID=151549 RepID=A0A4C1TZI7_EUMVA|nr:Putative inositol monophosphatase 3 [Eumeta japonica]
MLKVAIYVAELGGKKVVETKDQILHIESKGKTLEEVNDPVTEADYVSHCAMYYSLRNIFPQINVISEEHTSKCAIQDNDYDASSADHHAIDRLNDEFVFSKDVTIWIDPLDATKEYTEGLYQYVTTMVCVAIKGVPVVGVIHYPFASQTYWGWIPSATSPNIANIVQKEENKEHPKVVVSISHAGTVKDLAFEAFGAKTTVLSAAGAGFKAMGVVNGTYDIYLHTSAIKKWDICAGNAILNAVNGEMRTTKGDKIDYTPKDSTDHKVTDGIVATRHHNDYYLKRIIEEMDKKNVYNQKNNSDARGKTNIGIGIESRAASEVEFRNNPC